MRKTVTHTKTEAAQRGELVAFWNAFSAVHEASELIEPYFGGILPDFTDAQTLLATYLIKPYLEKEITELKKKLPNYSDEQISRMVIANLAYEAVELFNKEQIEEI